MKEVKKFIKYIIIGILFYIVSTIFISIGLNATYKNIKSENNIPNQIEIELAQSTSVNGRIYGKVTSTEENDLNGKYLKVQIYTQKGNYAGTKMLKISDTNINEPKKFMINFTAEHIGSYKIEIIDDSEEAREQARKYSDLFKNTFTDEEVKMYSTVILVLLLTFGI